jgi:hypothetical protein
MKPVKIDGCTRELGKPHGWDDETHGPCGSLPIRDEIGGGDIPRMVSFWRPSEAELKLLNEGALVLLYVVGRTHPPVILTVAKE